MASLAPLQIVVFRHTNDVEMMPFEEAIVRAFQGGKEAAGYVAAGDDLGIQLEVFSSAPTSGASVAATLDSFCHTLVVVLIDAGLLGEGRLLDWLAECWAHVNGSGGRHGMLPVAMNERLGDEFRVRRSGFDTLQLLHAHELGERSIRPAMFALRSLHECRLLLAPIRK